MWFELLGHSATVVGTIGFIWYGVSIYRGETKPSRMTWFILTAIATIVAIVNLEMQATTTLGLYIMSAFGSLIIFLLSLSRGVGGWDTHDKIALAGVTLAIGAWFIVGNPFISLLIALSFDFWGLYPTIVKVAYDPASEAWLPWVITLMSSVLNLAAINIMTLPDNFLNVGLSPVYYLVIDGLVTSLILLPFLINRPLLRISDDPQTLT